MVIEIVPYQEELISEVQQFNGRLRASGVDRAFGLRSLLRETATVPARLPGSVSSRSPSWPWKDAPSAAATSSSTRTSS